LFGEFKYTKEEINEFALIKKPSVPENFLEYFKKDHRHIIFHTKSQGSAVEWGAKNFIDLANDLPKDIRIFLTGTSKEGELIRDSLIHPLKDRAIDLTGKMTLDELIAFIGNCDGLVAASTGPLHIAGVCGIHALGLFSNKRPIHPGRWGAIGPKAEFVLNPYWENCDDPIKEINEIPIVVVKRAILSWF
jgi:heptosyltransferase-3